ncbi:hypothetical protein VNO78_18279 [Psophocarpus tetragonolobus]|uniref:Uncharacterized protein n=1 Tax=Psophocarpus tetragonolobus TaxID=3891 RepID=A0AAN9SPM4_PSOTE
MVREGEKDRRVDKYEIDKGESKQIGVVSLYQSMLTAKDLERRFGHLTMPDDDPSVHLNSVERHTRNMEQEDLYISGPHPAHSLCVTCLDQFKPLMHDQNNICVLAPLKQDFGLFKDLVVGASKCGEGHPTQSGGVSKKGNFGGVGCYWRVTGWWKLTWDMQMMRVKNCAWEMLNARPTKKGFDEERAKVKGGGVSGDQILIRNGNVCLRSNLA